MAHFAEIATQRPKPRPFPFRCVIANGTFRVNERPSARRTVVVTMRQFCRGPTVTPPEPMPTVTSESFVGVPPDLSGVAIQHACTMGPERIVSKRWDRVTAQGDRRTR